MLKKKILLKLIRIVLRKRECPLNGPVLSNFFPQGGKKCFKACIPKHAQFSTRQLAFFQRRMTKNEDSLEAGRPAGGYERA